MTDRDVPDFYDIQLQLFRLERAEAKLQAQHDRIGERLASLPTEFTQAQYREIAANLAAIRSRIEELQAQLRRD